MRGLIVDEIALAQQRQTREVVPAGEVLGASEPGRAPARRPERVGAERLPRERAQSPPLVVAHALGRRRLLCAVEHAQLRSLKRWILPVAVLGSSGTNSIQRGYLYGA